MPHNEKPNRDRKVPSTVTVLGNGEKASAERKPGFLKKLPGLGSDSQKYLPGCHGGNPGRNTQNVFSSHVIFNMSLVSFLIKKQPKENEVIGKGFFLQSPFYKMENTATE